MRAGASASDGARQSAASTSDGSIYVRVPTPKMHGYVKGFPGASSPSVRGQTAKLLVAVRTRPVESNAVLSERVERGVRAVSTCSASGVRSTSVAPHGGASTLSASTQSILTDRSSHKSILRVVNRDTVVVVDPDEEKAYLDQVQRRSKARRYTFDVAFGDNATNAEVYEATGRGLISAVVNGMNSTVFAYGATGSGKTHTMIGNYDEPGMMFLSLVDIFDQIKSMEHDYEFEVKCSYLEVYNELIYDLLVVDSTPLELREDPERGPVPMGLTRIAVTCPDDITKLLHEGNERRSVDHTEANATSSRSHAVLEISVKRWERNARSKAKHVLCGKLSLVDLAGSERAADTQNSGQKLRDGANINKSLLALANCINALGRHSNSTAKGRMYIPYRNSKLTRLLKDGLSGNSRTAMIATVNASSEQYNHTINTLKYANRAKEIKTNVAQNVVIARERHHIGDYQHVIDDLQSKVARLKTQLANKEASITNERLSQVSQNAASVTESWLDALSDDINENVEERINIEKALFELEDINAQNLYERSSLKHRLIGVTEKNPHDPNRKVLKGRIDSIDETIRENEALGAKYRKDIDANEVVREAIQSRIDSAMSEGKSPSFLRILSQYRLVGVKNMELHFQLAIRDQLVSEQREMIQGLWSVMSCAGLSESLVHDIANREGIRLDRTRSALSTGRDTKSVDAALRSRKNTTEAPRNVAESGITRSHSGLQNRTQDAKLEPLETRRMAQSPLAARRHVAALERVAARSTMSSNLSGAGNVERSRPMSARTVSRDSSGARDRMRSSMTSEVTTYLRSAPTDSPRTRLVEPRASQRLIEARASRAQRQTRLSTNAARDKAAR